MEEGFPNQSSQETLDHIKEETDFQADIKLQAGECPLISQPQGGGR